MDCHIHARRETALYPEYVFVTLSVATEDGAPPDFEIPVDPQHPLATLPLGTLVDFSCGAAKYDNQ